MHLHARLRYAIAALKPTLPGRRAAFISGSAKFEPSRPLVFMHIPKTGGTSLSDALGRALCPSRVVGGGVDRSMFGDFDDFSAIDESIRRHIYLSADALPDAELVMGHMAYSTLKQRFPEAQFMTVLREPCVRILSNWLYGRSLRDDQISPWGSWAERVRLTQKPLVSVLRQRSLAVQFDNVVTRMLLSPHPLIPFGDFINPRHGRRLLAEAGHRLSRFDFVDVIENPAFPDRLQRWLGRSLDLRWKNQTSVPAGHRSCLFEDLTQEAFDLLAQRSWLDLELWADVARRFVPERQLEQFRERTMLRNVARYAALTTA